MSSSVDTQWHTTAIHASPPVCFINKELLLDNKRAAGRPKDLADVVYLSKKMK
jgi:hypothetical protein